MNLGLVTSKINAYYLNEKYDIIKICDYKFSKKPNN